MKNGKATFVLVHGAWLGGWCWEPIRERLGANGSRVLTPTLSGLGERGHLTDPVPSLQTHIEDIVRVIEWEELEDVTLIGHSYGGMVITAVADRLKSKLRNLVYIDAAVPGDGDDFASQAPGVAGDDLQKKRDWFRSLSDDGKWIRIPDPAILGVKTARDLEWFKRRMTRHPLGTWLEPVKFENGGNSGVRKTYILATDPPATLMGYPAHAETAKGGGEWSFRSIHCGHCVMVAEPERTAELILESAAS